MCTVRTRTLGDGPSGEVSRPILVSGISQTSRAERLGSFGYRLRIQMKWRHGFGNLRDLGYIREW